MIFSRSSIQHFINKLSETLPQEAIARLVQNLNRNNETSLAYEWEVAVLFALNKLGNIEYEVCHGGESALDVTFRLPSHEKVNFVADIATVSDRGLDDENPIEMLSRFLHRKAQTLGLPGGFSYRVEGSRIGHRFENRKVKLAMPNRKELHPFLKEHITPRLRRIKEANLDRADISINEDPYQISITYDKNYTMSSGSHPSYTAAYSLEKNPVYTSLKAKKRQLAKSGFEGRKGIILCDGACSLLRSQRTTSAMSYSDRDVIGNFLRQNRSVSFIITFWVERPAGDVFARIQAPQLCSRLFPNPQARFPLDGKVAQLFEQLHNFLPTPIVDANVAKRRVQTGKYGTGISHYGRSTVSYSMPRTIRISARALLHLLAEKTDPASFARDHWRVRSDSGEQIENPFRSASMQDMVIRAVSVEHQKNEDDDWITFELEYDVAVSPFRNDHSET